MPTYYVEDHDGEKNDDAVEPLTLSPVFHDPVQAKRVDVDAQVEDKAVTAPARKTVAKKSPGRKS